MATELDPQIVERLRGVMEPDFRASIVDLKMITQASSSRNKAHVEIATLKPLPDYADELEGMVVDALKDYYKDIKVRILPGSESAIEAIAEALVSIEGTAAAAARLERKPPFSAGNSPTRVIGISSGKGGVGKSSVTVNLAVALAKMGNEVGLLDADVYGFSVPAMLGIERKPQLIGNLMVPPVGHGVKVMSVGFFVSDDTPVIWRGPMLHKTLEQFIIDVFWGKLDYLLIDMPPGTGDVALSLGEYLPKSEVFVVTTPQLAAERVAQRSALAARKLKLPVRGVIENMSYFVGDDGKKYEIFGSGGGKALAESLSVPLVGQIPLSVTLREGGDSGVPEASGKGPEEFLELAQRIIDMGPARRYRSELKVN